MHIQNMSTNDLHNEKNKLCLKISVPSILLLIFKNKRQVKFMYLYCMHSTELRNKTVCTFKVLGRVFRTKAVHHMQVFAKHD